MMNLYNIYCDESCHLEHDHINTMVLGAIWCDQSAVSKISESIRKLKVDYGLARHYEMKWVKVSPAKTDFYLAVVQLFFDSPELNFRGVVIPDKSKLNHQAYKQDHDGFYYKMFFNLLKIIFAPKNQYNIYLDIKDTKSQDSVNGLKYVLCNSRYDFNQKCISRVQQIRSHESELLQISDLFIGALAYLHRGLNSNSAKLKIIEKIQKSSGYHLKESTLLKKNKFNLFIWQAQEINKEQY